MLDPGRRVGTNLDHLFDRTSVERRLMDLLLCQPETGKADEVGCEAGKVFLKQERLRRTDLEVVHLEDIFAFLDARLDGLAGVVAMKPAIQIGADIFLAVMDKDGISYILASLIASQSEIDRVGEVAASRGIGPRSERCIAAHLLPDVSGERASIKPSRTPVLRALVSKS